MNTLAVTILSYIHNAGYSVASNALTNLTSTLYTASD